MLINDSTTCINDDHTREKNREKKNSINVKSEETSRLDFLYN